MKSEEKQNELKIYYLEKTRCDNEAKLKELTEQVSELSFDITNFAIQTKKIRLLCSNTTITREEALESIADITDDLLSTDDHR